MNQPTRVFLLAVFGAAILLLPASAAAQGKRTLLSFTGSPSDGDQPIDIGGLIMDASGNLFGTTQVGGASNVGTVFELVNSSGTYTENVLYSFTGAPDGANPFGGLIMDVQGNLYGTTRNGGANNYGTVFELVNSSGSSGTYSEKVLYNFFGGGDGAQPLGDLIMDASGNLFGTTSSADINNGGTVFELVKSSGYSENVLYNFGGSVTDGATPVGGLIMDASGNLFGTTDAGGTNGSGTVFELVKSSGYSENVLYNFGGSVTDGAIPYANLIMDASGNLFGTTVFTAAGGGLVGATGHGTVFELVMNCPTTTAVTSSPNPATAGDAVSLTATVTCASPACAGLSPTGTVTFSTSTLSVSANLVSGSASVTLPDAEGIGGIGTFKVMAQYMPNSSVFVASSGTLSQTINEAGVVLTSGNNTLTGNQTINGIVSASGFAGNGSGLTNVTASGVSCAGCIGNTQLGISYAAGDTQGGSALNALLFGGLLPSAFAPANGSGNYVAKTGDTMTGTLSVPSLLSTGNVSGTSGNFTGNASQDIFDVVQNGSGNALGGFSLGTTGRTLGVFGSVASPAGQGVRGVATATSGGGGIGVVGSSAGDGSAGPAGVGVQGEATSPTGFTFAIRGVNSGTGGTGVFGVATTSTGSTTGVMGQVSSPNGIAGRFVSTAGGLLLSGENGSGTLFRVDGGGNVTATSYAGNGAGLTNIQASTLSPGAIISGSQVSGPVANAVSAASATSLTGNISDTQVTNLSVDLANASASAVSTSEAFSKTTFLPLAGGTMTGTLNLPANGLSAGGNQLALANGVVGIGTASPDANLTISSVTPSCVGNFSNACIQLRVNSNDSTNGAFIGLTAASGASTPWGVYRYGSNGGTTNTNNPFSQVANRFCVGVYGVNEPFCIHPNGSVGMTFNLTVGGAISASNFTASGGVTAASFTGNGASLTNIQASTVSPAATVQGSQVVGAVANATNAVTAANLTGNIKDTQVNNLATDLAAASASAVTTSEAYANSTFLPLAGGTMTGTLNAPTVNVSGNSTTAGSTTTGTLTISTGGTPIKEHLSMSFNPSFAALKQGTCATANFTLTGAADGDTIALGVPNARMTGGGNMIYTAWVSAAGTITIQACNVNPSMPQKTAGSGAIRVDLWKH